MSDTKIVSLINFHGLTLLVMAHNDIEYIYTKPLVDLAGLNWRKAKRTLLTEDNVVLFGIQTLKHPVLVAEGGPRATPSEGIYMRLDRARMFLARINTSQMKAQGKVEAAEALLKLQIEWANAIHRYETDGVAYKKATATNLTQLINLLKVRTATHSGNEKQALTKLVHQQLAELGSPVEAIASPQKEMTI